MKRNTLIFLITILILLVLTPRIYYKIITRGAQKISIQEDEVILNNEFSQKYPHAFSYFAGRNKIHISI